MTEGPILTDQFDTLVASMYLCRSEVDSHCCTHLRFSLDGYCCVANNRIGQDGHKGWIIAQSVDLPPKPPIHICPYLPLD